MIKNIIKESLSPDKEYIYGFADLAGLLDKKYIEYRYGIVIGVKLDDDIIDSISEGPNNKYLDLYRNTNSELWILAKTIEKKLGSENIYTRAIPPTITEEDRNKDFYKSLRLDFSHKMVATRAGLGWIGKTALFISEKFGPRLRLVSLLTDFPIETFNKPYEESQCGDCKICIQKCPADASNGKLWDINTDRDEFFNAFKCREKCKEFSINNVPICGICVSVCPIGKI